MNSNPPNFDRRFFCIVNRDEPEMAAVASSYLASKESYLPMFEFPRVLAKKEDIFRIEGEVHEFSISDRRAREFTIRLYNSLHRLGGCDYLILIGITSEQKSYLDFLDDHKVIEITKVDDIDDKLNSFNSHYEYQYCKAEQILTGLYSAVKQNKLLKIDAHAEDVEIEIDGEGIIIVEDIKAVSSIIAVNYAMSINAGIWIIQEPSIDKHEIKYLIEKWQNGDVNAYNDLSASLYPQFENLDFSCYKYGTFFTVGSPYSLILKDIIPFTYVNLVLYPDFFLFNCIYFDSNSNVFSAVVFSPLEFGTNEETVFVIAQLESNNYHIRQLVDKEATVYNLDYHVREYPFELMHICSHGGEIEGSMLKEEFTDREGRSHAIEYDEVVSFAPDPSDGMVQVATKRIWRRLNGYDWKSPALKAQNYPDYVFVDMVNKAKRNNIIAESHKLKIDGSCAIKCSHFSYQGMFNELAGHHTSPFIFNNTCWSWAEISDNFLALGARGYIGTLWDVENSIAKEVAEEFYRNAYTDTILNSIQKASAITKGTKNENIYIYWGLHFSSLKQGIGVSHSKSIVGDLLFYSVIKRWEQKQLIESTSVGDNLNKLINWGLNQLKFNFPVEFSKNLQIYKEAYLKRKGDS